MIECSHKIKKGATMEVLVRELKANLSRYLKLIEESKSLEVTKYRRKVARIVPVKDTSKDSENEKITKLLRSGIVAWGCTTNLLS